jgi:hypothetical protein
MITDKDIQLLFIEEELDQHGEYLHDLLEEKLKSKRLYKTGALEEELDYKVKSVGKNKVLQFYFFTYGRLLEIVNKRSKNSQRTVNTNTVLWGIKSNRDKKRNMQWYTRTVYGSLNRLIGRLGNEFVEEEKKRLRGILESREQRQYSKMTIR